MAALQGNSWLHVEDGQLVSCLLSELGPVTGGLLQVPAQLGLLLLCPAKWPSQPVLWTSQTVPLGLHVPLSEVAARPEPADAVARPEPAPPRWRGGP